MSAITRFKDAISAKPTGCPEQEYLIGLRGLLVLESFIWTFMVTFVPAAVKDSDNTTGPVYQLMLKKTLSVLFWNETLIYSFFIILSARTVCVTFISNPTKQSVASSAFRRGLRLWFPVAASLAIVKICSTVVGWKNPEDNYINTFMQETGNTSIKMPYYMPTTLSYFNSVFNLFWVTHGFQDQSGSRAFPTQTMWLINVLYTQTYTVYMTMVIIPYTRKSWRVKSLIAFIITAWWVQSWAWYSITGMLFADLVMTMNLKQAASRGIPIPYTRARENKPSKIFRLPSWIPMVCVLAAGTIMMFVWTAWKPQDVNQELMAHSATLYGGSGGLVTDLGFDDEYSIRQPQARDDNYVFLVGFFFLLECSDMMQYVFSNPLFTYLGRRSLSWFLVQSTIMYTAGIKLFMHLRVTKNWPFEDSTIAVLAVCLVAVVPAAEVFYRFVDVPSQKFAHVVFNWIRE